MIGYYYLNPTGLGQLVGLPTHFGGLLEFPRHGRLRRVRSAPPVGPVHPDRPSRADPDAATTAVATSGVQQRPCAPVERQCPIRARVPAGHAHHPVPGQALLRIENRGADIGCACTFRVESVHRTYPGTITAPGTSRLPETQKRGPRQCVVRLVDPDDVLPARLPAQGVTSAADFRIEATRMPGRCGPQGPGVLQHILPALPGEEAAFQKSTPANVHLRAVPSICRFQTCC